MAATTYKSPAITTNAQRRTAYALLTALINHLESFGVDITSVNVSGSPAVLTIVLNNPIPADQEDHFKLTKV